jgi:undecaprenyl-diphosphatase
MDTVIVVWVATHRVDILNDPSVWLGTIEKLGAVWIVLAAVAALARGHGPRRATVLALFTGLAAFAADSASFLVKDATDRPRPFEAHSQVHPLYVVHSSSFPAGHAATAFAGAVVLAAIAPRLAPWGVALAFLIGFTRVYDGVHYPSDVAAGGILGVAVGAAAVYLGRVSGVIQKERPAPARPPAGQGTSEAAPNVSS